MLRSAFYGDDFTGATDTLATYADAGWRALLFLGVPQPRHRQAAGELDVLGIAGAARAMDRAAMAAELAPVAGFFSTLRAPVLHYKCCSTFDSAPEAGNVATAIGVLRAAVADPVVAIVGGQPSLGRYCVFGQLFARAANDVVHRLDRHPTMSRHPVTPMHEADLGLHLAALGLPGVAGIAWPSLEEGLADQRLTELAAQGAPAVLFDALTHAHLAAIGPLLWSRAQQQGLLAVGASSVAQALIAAWGAQGRGPLVGTPIAPAASPVLVLAGSRSPLTALQVDQARRRYVVLPVDPAQLLADPGHDLALAAQAAGSLQQGAHVLLQTDPQAPCDAAPARVAAASAQLLARVLALVPRVRRVGVAGGDTASLAVQALAPWGLSSLGRLAPGVSLVRAHADDARVDGLQLMLKGGQMGGADLFDRLLAGSG